MGLTEAQLKKANKVMYTSILILASFIAVLNVGVIMTGMPEAKISAVLVGLCGIDCIRCSGMEV